jgi:hypothetical protein
MVDYKITQKYVQVNLLQQQDIHMEEQNEKETRPMLDKLSNGGNKEKGR